MSTTRYALFTFGWTLTNIAALVVFA